MKFTLILVVYDPGDLFTHPRALPAAIESIFALEGDADIVIANNTDPALSPRTSAYLKALPVSCPGVRLIEHGRNYGCSGGFNRAVRALDNPGDILIYMSCDALIVDAKLLLKMERVFTSKKKIGALHPLSVYEDFGKANVSSQWSYDAFIEDLERIDQDPRRLPDEPDEAIDAILSDIAREKPGALRGPLPQLPLTFYAVRRDLFLSMGGFNEEFIAGWENIDIALRMYKKGYRSAVMKDAFVFHRRLLFRILGQAGQNQQLLISDVESGEAVWNRLWGGMPHADAWRDLRHGKILHRCLLRPGRLFTQYLKGKWRKVRGLED
jgi:GT2 family glycosyltransferase